ncbi:hypothetical protein Ciccas_000725 [Cichlidogyrus casuarinus]|uniref:Uncharacterized protein n=1 Tax=Cichlidogyrus casuarinus TaxID=1844966 RepID=A0ABD2QMD8_9PLAT
MQRLAISEEEKKREQIFRIRNAPFKIDEKRINIKTYQQLIQEKTAVKGGVPRSPRPRNLDRLTACKIESFNHQKDFELIKGIKNHRDAIANRAKFAKTKSTVKEEEDTLRQAEHDLHVARELLLQIHQRREALELGHGRIRPFVIQDTQLNFE